MRLISAHIENFGKLSDENFDFEKDLNVLYKENGWGKSTLATFLRAMFYGLEGDGKRDEISSERKRYSPWQGGPFGGSVTFEAKGKSYVLTRFFGSKSAEDSFELRDKESNMISTDFSDNIGEELFEINSESFMHSVFISQNDCLNAGTTDDINAKLGNISDGIDLNRYASTEEAFKTALNNYSATRKTGEIYKMKARLSELKAIVNDGKGLDDTVAGIENRIAGKKESITEINVKLRNLGIEKHRAAKAEADRVELKHYETLKKDCEDKAEAVRLSREFFKGDLPDEELIEQWEKAVDEISESEAVKAGTELTEAENVLYISLLETFREGKAREEDIVALIKKAEELERLKSEQEKTALNDAEENELVLLTEAYGDVDEASEGIKEAVKDWNNREKLMAEHAVLMGNLSDEDYAHSESDRRKGPVKFMVALGVILCLAGVGLFFVTQFLVAMILAGVGLLLTVSGFVRLSSMGKHSSVLSANAQKIRERLENIEAEAEDIESAIKELLNEHGIDYIESEVPGALNVLSEELFTYRSLLKKASLAREHDYSERINSITGEITEYLYRYPGTSRDGGFIERLTDLKGKSGHYDSLRDKVEKNRDAKLRSAQLKEALSESLKALSINPGIDIFDTVEKAAKAYREYKTAYKLYEDAAVKVVDFEKTHDLDKLRATAFSEGGQTLEEIAVREEALKDELEALRASLAVDERSFDDYEERLVRWNEVRVEAEQLEKLIEEKKKRLELIEKAEAKLSLAKEKLTARYMEPLLKGFSKYYKALTGDDATGYHIDANAVITKEEKGKQRSVMSLSYGYKDLIGFCMRLANADAMYSGEKPFLIMDDPFVNLDDIKMDGARKLLKEASGEYQIIYLTCRENRL